MTRVIIFVVSLSLSVCERAGAMDAYRHGWTGVEREEEVWDWVWCVHSCGMGADQFFFVEDEIRCFSGVELVGYWF